MKYIMVFAVIFLSTIISAGCSTTPKDENSILVGQFGFDWLQPNQSECIELTTNQVASFKTCVYEDNCTFGGIESTCHQCRVNDKSEYLIYETITICTEQYETMMSNE